MEITQHFQEVVLQHLLQLVAVVGAVLADHMLLKVVVRVVEAQAEEAVLQALE